MRVDIQGKRPGGVAGKTERRGKASLVRVGVEMCRAHIETQINNQENHHDFYFHSEN
jgi:hypothetical protein